MGLLLSWVRARCWDSLVIIDQYTSSISKTEAIGLHRELEEREKEL